MKRLIAADFAIMIVGLILLSGCGTYNDKRGRGDAPVLNNRGDDSPAQVYNFPDHFPNVATKCDGYGHRIYVVTHNKTDPPPVVIEDTSCPGKAR